MSDVESDERPKTVKKGKGQEIVGLCQNCAWVLATARRYLTYLQHFDQH